MLKLSEALAGWKPAQGGAPTEPLALIETVWGEIVGAEVAQNSRPTRIAGGTLTVTARSSAWSHQLTFLSEHVLRAAAARLPSAGIRAIRFRVGALTEGSIRHPRTRRKPAAAATSRSRSANAAEALAHFRSGVESRRQTARSEGWNECRRCGALVAPEGDALCTACAAARSRELGAATARLLFEAPWLGCAGTIALIDGLQVEEYERIRTQLLAHWWGILARARAAKRLSRDGRERLVASSYVLLQSRLAPEEIRPATVRSILGDELHDLLYDEA